MRIRKFSDIWGSDMTISLWMMAIAVVIIGYYNSYLGIAGALLLGYLFYHNLHAATRKKEELRLYIENLSENVDTATKNAILNLPFPLVIIDDQGIINWYNMHFSNVFQGEYILDKKLSSYLSGVDIGRISKNGMEKFRNINIKDKYYDIYCNLINVNENSEEKNLIIMYFVDKTDFISLRGKYNDEKSIAAIIMMDNIEEVLKEAEEASRPALVAEVDRRINAWAALNYASVYKYSNVEYMLYFSQKQLTAMEEKRFDILDSIRDINAGNKIPITLSIGVGVNGKNHAELQKSCTSAMDIALGRGGDQAVVKNNEKLSFYGGKTKAVEKRTRVKARVIAYALKQLIEQSDDVIVMGHEIPDLDCMGAALGIYRCCRGLNKEVKIVLSSVNAGIANLWAELQEDEEYADVFVSPQEALQIFGTNTLLVVVDVHRPAFTVQRQLVEKAEKIAIIDHHRRGSEFIENAVITYIEPYASSTSELVTELLQYMFEKPKIKQIEAEALLAGIFIDTKNFSFQTGVRTFEAASYLRKMGADTTLTKQLFQDDLETFLTRAEVVKGAQMFKNNIAISTIPFSAKNPALVAAQAADELLNIKGINASFVLSCIEDDIFISGRSLGDINVQVVLEKLGGGGHLSVAGAQLSGLTMEKAIVLLKKAIEEYLKEGER
ncbi:MAG: DHH family phosphoesterase [Clostridiaceae bacterium]|nr:DHH family phosphoesterase [Clostridiaceae bacterium]